MPLPSPGSAGPSRLPPPAFPPGRLREATRSAAPGGEGEASRPEGPEIASPSRLRERGVGISAPEAGRRASAPGVSAPPRLHDPHLAELVRRIDRLARDLREEGEEALRLSPGMDRFEVTLRSYCLRFLAGRRGQ